MAFYFILSAASYWPSREWIYSFSYDDYKDYLSLVAGVSGMVFTIMGIWIAFLYPNAMARIANPEKIIAADFSESKSDAKRLESIVGAVMCSALVMVVILLLALSKLVISSTPIYSTYRIEFKCAALSALFFVTLAQLETVIHVVISNVMFINDLHFKRMKRESDGEI